MIGEDEGMAQTVGSVDLQDIRDFDLPDYNDIPDIGLFLEQAVKYVNGYLEPLGDVSLTGSMISNYVKKKIIANPVKKQYNREQLAYLFFIAAAKTCLSLENLQRLIEIQRAYCSCESAYEYFRTELRDALKDVFADGAAGFTQVGDKAEAAGMQERSDMNENGTSQSSATSPERELLRKTAVTIAHQVYLARSIANLVYHICG